MRPEATQALDSAVVTRGIDSAEYSLSAAYTNVDGEQRRRYERYMVKNIENFTRPGRVGRNAVIGVPDDLRGNIIKAFIVLAEAYAPSEMLAGQIQNHVRGQLAAYEYPRQIEFLTELPVTTTGKVRRAELRRKQAENLHGGRILVNGREQT